MNRLSTKAMNVWSCVIGVVILMTLSILVPYLGVGSADAQEAASAEKDRSWIDEIEKVFVPSEQCKQCHDRHYEEWERDEGANSRSQDFWAC